MIGRKLSRKVTEEEEQPRGFDSFDLRLGDTMRGERATLGKSLMDVERELRIKAAYVAAIENSDPGAFDTPGFIPGYVRSYARYLGMNPDEAFAEFCRESGFSTAHGMSSEASSRRKADLPIARLAADRDPLASPNTPFVPKGEGALSRIEPGAIGSALVLIALIGAIGYGGWSVLNEVQRVKFAPVENTPDVLSDLDPLAGAETPLIVTSLEQGGTASGVFQPPEDRLDRLYRPQALDVPVMVARDAPISTLDPAEVGSFRGAPPQIATASAEPSGPHEPLSPQVVEGPGPEVMVVAVRPAWVRVRSADGTVIFEGIMDAGDTYAVPATEEPATLRAGESGAVYFAVNGQHYGPAGARGAVTADLALSADVLTQSYELADLERDEDLSLYVASLQQPVQPEE